MTIVATWNVNSLKARLDHLLKWLESASPDVVVLQEIKMLEDSFPFMETRGLGYRCAVKGQKTYNGVAILSKSPIEVTAERLPGNETDEQARYLEAKTAGIRVGAIYLPNGNPVADGKTEKFIYKLRWMRLLKVRAETLLKTEETVVLGGDYNVAPDDGDVYDPDGWTNDALCRPESRSAFRELLHLGYTDAIRATSAETGRYSWWDYRGGGWQKDFGARIDHLLLSPQAADRLENAGIDKTPRGWEKPSDHTPVWCKLRAA